jgi:hypothetical protein
MKNHFLDYKKILEKMKNFFPRIPWFFGKHSFFVILIFVLVAVSLGGLLYYNYVIIEKEIIFRNEQGLVKFRKDVYSKILEKWDDEKKETDQFEQETNEENLEDIEKKEYKNPFIKSE